MRFVDEVTIRVQAGKGGNGCVSFRREKYVPKGGPDGGDGGKGGDVILEASRRKHTLLDFRYRQIFKAGAGKHGEGQNRHGRGGEDLLLEVPVGTIVKLPETGEILADLLQEKDRFTAARGAPGGRGNARFVSSTRQVPRFAQDGQDGEERELLLELKLIADVGLVGLPNAGKSTLIAAISAARPKVADYPFTTLVPNLGVVQYEDAPSFVVADIPGLIEGAHKGAGLGTRFLRHIERTRILVHLVDAAALPEEDILEPYLRIEKELEAYSESMADKGRVIVLNKTDLVSEPARLEAITARFRETGYAVIPISALLKRGVGDLVRTLAIRLAELESAESGPEE